MKVDLTIILVVVSITLGMTAGHVINAPTASEVKQSIRVDSLTARADSLILVSLDQCIQLVRARHLDPHDYCALKLVAPEDSAHE